MKNAYTLFGILCLICSLSFAQHIQKMDSIVDSYHNTHPDVSISIGLLYNDTPHFVSRGTLSRKSTIAVDQHSIFEIASITKMLTAHLIAQAVNEKRIKLTDFIDSYLPKVYQLQKEIQGTIRISDLASHQSGLPDIDFAKLIASNSQQPTASVTIDNLSSLINTCDELIDYGVYRYSTMSYVLLGQILETVYKESYENIIKEKILIPLQMDETLTSDFNIPHTVTGYNPNGGEQELFTWNVVAPAGLLKSNTTDMLTYLDAMLGAKEQISDAAMIMEEVFYKDKNREVGLGIQSIRDEGNTIYLKTGDSMGQSSIAAYSRNQQWALIILINQRNNKLRAALFNDIYEKVLK